MKAIFTSFVFLLLIGTGYAQTSKTLSFPKTVRSPETGTLKYRVLFSLGDRTSTLVEEDGRWVATHELYSIAGSTKDVVVLDKGTLQLRRRTFTRGAAAYHIDISGNKATGFAKKDGKETPISADLGGPLFASGHGGARAIACLPLAEGYSVTVRGFDIEKQQLVTAEVKVTGSEKVEIPAGTFETFKVELKAEERAADLTLWIDKSSRKTVKMSLFIGNILTTAELEGE
jgi:hypothetical protein